MTGSASAQVEVAWSHLRTSFQWAIVYDGVENGAEILDLLPPSNGCVILTSRSESVSRLTGNSIGLKGFTKRQSLELIGKIAPRMSGSERRAIADWAGSLPLAVEQMACFISDTGISIEDYAELLRTTPDSAGLADSTITQHPGMLPIVMSAVEYLRSNNSFALSVLEAFSFLADGALTVLPETAQADRFGLRLGNLPQTTACVRTLSKTGLVGRSGITLQVHAMVQLLVRATLQGDARNEALGRAEELLVSAALGDPVDPKNWERYSAIVPHAVFLSCCLSEESQSMGSLQTAAFRQLILAISRYMYVSGQYDASRRLVELLLPSWLELGEAHLDVLALRNRLGTALLELGLHDEALKILESVYNSVLRTFGRDEVRAFSALNNYIVILNRTGRRDKAYKLCSEAYERAKSILGESDAHTMRLGDNLGVILTLERKLGQAMLTLQEVLRARTLALGAAHQDTLWTADNLAEVLIDRGERQAAREVLEITLAKASETLGSAHPVTVRALDMLGVLDA